MPSLFLISKFRLILSFGDQMLKAIGVIKESKKGAEEPYQDSVTAPLDQEDERHIDEKEDDWEDDNWEVEDEEALSRAILGKLLLEIGKVHAIECTSHKHVHTATHAHSFGVLHDACHTLSSMAEEVWLSYLIVYLPSSHVITSRCTTCTPEHPPKASCLRSKERRSITKMVISP